VEWPHRRVYVDIYENSFEVYNLAKPSTSVHGEVFDFASAEGYEYIQRCLEENIGQENRHAAINLRLSFFLWH
jgi:hypothetical protein